VTWHALMDVALAAGDSAAVFDVRADMAAAGYDLNAASWTRMVAAGSQRSAAEAESLLMEMTATGLTPTPAAVAHALGAAGRECDADVADRVVAMASAAAVQLTAAAQAGRLHAVAGRGVDAVTRLYSQVALPGTPLARDRRLLNAAMDARFGKGGVVAALGVTSADMEDGGIFGASPPPPPPT